MRPATYLFHCLQLCLEVQVVVAQCLLLWYEAVEAQERWLGHVHQQPDGVIKLQSHTF